MSNPGVIKLVQLTQSIENFPYRFDIEDNIGEAIHIHYRDIRLDMSIKEFLKLADTAERMIEELVDVKDFSCSKFDNVNLVGLAALLPYLKEIREEQITLGELFTIGEDDRRMETVVPLGESRIVKALKGET